MRRWWQEPQLSGAVARGNEAFSETLQTGTGSALVLVYRQLWGHPHVDLSILLSIG
jgi:hypothetical protein